jgi:hypothetical protein
MGFYQSPEQFVLTHGEWYKPRPLPRGVWRGTRKLCFGNAIYIAAAYGLPYVEGYSLLTLKDEAPTMLHHAWNLDAQGLLLDTTWVPYPGLAYCGVTFSVERADDCTWNGDASVLDDWRRGWPLLQQEWHGEPAELVWPASPRLAVIRKYAQS